MIDATAYQCLGAARRLKEHRPALLIHTVDQPGDLAVLFRPLGSDRARLVAFFHRGLVDDRSYDIDEHKGLECEGAEVFLRERLDDFEREAKIIEAAEFDLEALADDLEREGRSALDVYAWLASRRG
jgi:hypothetical protein